MMSGMFAPVVQGIVCERTRLAQAASLALRLHKGQNVALADRADHVADDRAAAVVEELDANLRALTTRAGAAEHLADLGEL